MKKALLSPSVAFTGLRRVRAPKLSKKQAADHRSIAELITNLYRIADTIIGYDPIYACPKCREPAGKVIGGTSYVSAWMACQTCGICWERSLDIVS